MKVEITSYELSSVPIVCTPVAPTADTLLHIEMTTNSCECHQTYHGEKSPRFIGLILKLITAHSELRLVTFCVSRRRRKMYCGHARLCVCLSAVVGPHYCTDPNVTWRRGRGCPLVVHYWADLQSGHGLRCYGNITRTLVTSLCPSRDMTT